mgnify:CR=1 FL=1
MLIQRVALQGCFTSLCFLLFVFVVEEEEEPYFSILHVIPWTTRYMYVVGWLPGTGNQRYEEHTLIVALPFLFEKNQNLLLLLLLLLLCYRHAEHASLNWSHLLMSHVSIVTALALIFG